MKNTTIKTLLKIAMGTLMILSLTGCKSSAVSEKQIEADISSAEGMQFYNIESVDIVNRKTDKDRKIDTIMVSVTAENSEATITREYQLSYYLYDQGWSLEALNSTNTASWSAIPKNEPSQALIDEHVLYDIQNSNLEFLPEEGIANLYFSTIRETPNYTDTQSKQAQFYFNPEKTTWEYVSTNILNSEKDWHIDGTWELVNNHTVMGGSCVDNDYYTVNADITVENHTAYVKVYAVGSHPEYFNGEKNFEIDLTKGGYSEIYESEYCDYSEEVPGYMPITTQTTFCIDSDRVFLANLYLFERVGA